MQGKFKIQFECTLQSRVTLAGAWYLEKSLSPVQSSIYELTVYMHVALYIHIHVLTDAPKEFHEHAGTVRCRNLEEEYNYCRCSYKLNRVTHNKGNLFG